MLPILDQLNDLFGPCLQTAVALAPYTWMQVGGPAEYLLEARSIDRVIRARAFCRRHGLPFVLLGGGSNVVIDDAGLAGLVVINRSEHLRWDLKHRRVTVSAGYPLDRLVSRVSARGWGDLTFAAGIPGSVGGALAGGAGAYGRLLVDGLRSARILDADATVKDVAAAGLGVSYRHSEMSARGQIVLAATFGSFLPADATLLAGRIAQIKCDRAAKHPPLDLPCAGSFFKNLPPPESGMHRLAAGRILDECGAKQLRQGGAAVFAGHANIIVNTGGATAGDIHRLAERMVALVARQKGVVLEREVRYLSNRTFLSGLDRP